MKSMAFIRNTWKKRDKDNGKKAEREPLQAPSTPQITLVFGTAPSTPTTTTSFDSLATPPYSALPDHSRRPRTQSQEAISSNQRDQEPAPRRSPLSSSTPTLVNEWSIASPTTAFEQCHISPPSWKKTFHGPPQNAFHGPPDLKLYSPVLGKSPKTAGGTPPVRPPRPPPLNLHPTTTKRPVNTGVLPRSATRVTFALPPNPRGANSGCGDGKVNFESYSDSPSATDGTESISSKETTRCVCSATSRDGNHVSLTRSALADERTSNQSLLERNDPLPLTSSPPRLAHAVMGPSVPPTWTIYGSLNSSSTPHLPCQDKELPPIPPLPLINSNNHYTSASDFPLSLFPDPPPLFIRRKVHKRLLLQSKPSNAPVLQSPASTSTPLISPTTTRPHTSPTRSKSYSSLPKSSNTRVVPPPLFMPPTTPLPTPPNTPSTPNNEPQVQQLLRTVKSINQLQSDFLVPPILPTHRVTTSEPSNLADNMSKTRAQSGSEGRHKRMHSRVESRLIITQTHWGYAF